MQRRARSITSELFAPGTWGAIPTETLNSNSVSLSAFHLGSRLQTVYSALRLLLRGRSCVVVAVAYFFRFWMVRCLLSRNAPRRQIG